MARITLNNYLLPWQANSIVTKAHHHPVWIAVAKVSCIEIWDYLNRYYYLISVKYIKKFASLFIDASIIIFQDDKVKIDLSVLAVEWTFCML